MSASREACWEGLKTLLTTRLTAANFITRRLKEFTSVPAARLPAVFIQHVEESIERKPGEPPRRVLHGIMTCQIPAVVMTEKATDTPINAFMDAVDVAMKPDQPTGRLTIGGLVYDARVVGMTRISPDNIDAVNLSIVIGVDLVMQDDQEGSTRPFIFGSGWLYAIPQHQQTGSATADPTPVRVGALRDVTLETVNTLGFGEVSAFTFPTQAGIATTRLKGKARLAMIDGRAIAQLVFGGGSVSAGSTLAAPDVALTIPVTPGPYTITPAAPNAGTWAADLGVVYTATGAPLQQVSGAPVTGQYSVAAGTYTFAAADQGVGVSISFLYTTASGSSLALANPTAGRSADFQIVLFGQYETRQICWKLNACACPSFSLSTLTEQYAVQGFDFDVMGDPNNVGILSQL